jgi:hypothetical protein
MSIRNRANGEMAETRRMQVPRRPDLNGGLSTAMHQGATECKRHAAIRATVSTGSETDWCPAASGQHRAFDTSVAIPLTGQWFD